MDVQKQFDGAFSSAMTQMFIWMGVGLVITIVAIILVRRMVRPNTKLLQTGIAAQATILQVWQTGVTINNNPQIGLKLQVNGPTGSYQTETKVIAPLINIPQFQPGAVLPVKVDPADQSKIALDIYAA